MSRFFARTSCIALLTVIFFVSNSLADMVQSGGSVTITAVVNSNDSGGTGGSGGGGGGSPTPPTPITTPTIVNFSGKGYPSSQIVILLKDGVQATTTTVGSDANFSATLSNLSEGMYNFSVYTIDKDGRHSIAFSFPVYVKAGTTTTISDILLSPTIDLDKVEVRHGDPIEIFGYAVPNSSVTINVHSDLLHSVTTSTDKDGSYLYNFGTAPLEYGSHNAQSQSTLSDKISSLTNPVAFTVSDKNVLKDTKKCSDLRGDLNCDGHVNLIDFSIMAYWYKKPHPPTDIDLSGDGAVDLVDFSILAYHWTG